MRSTLIDHAEEAGEHPVPRQFLQLRHKSLECHRSAESTYETSAFPETASHFRAGLFPA